MNQIQRCDWLPERARWSYLARSGLPAASRKKNFPEIHIINPLLTKLVRSRWLDIRLVLFLRVYGPRLRRSINTQKNNLANIQPSWPHTWSITNTFWICVWGKVGHRNRMIIVTIVFKMFFVHAIKTETRRFQIPQVWRAFSNLKLRFRDGLVWTVSQTVEISLRFQISLA